MNAMCLRPFRRPARRQRGVYAVEYAFVFLFLFGLVYAIVCYGILFTFKLGLQNAAEDGARAALRHQASAALRQAKAEQVAEQQTTGWLPAAAGPVITSLIERLEPGSQPCGPTWNDRCQITITVKAQNLHQVLPPFPHFALPNELTGQANVLLGRSMQ